MIWSKTKERATDRWRAAWQNFRDIRKLFENVVDKTDKKPLERNFNHKCWKQKNAAGRYDGRYEGYGIRRGLH